MQTKKLKLVYILPEYRPDIATHFYHKVEMIEHLERELDIFLIVEHGKAPEGFANVYVQYFRWLPLRTIELFSILLALRLLGYRRFWTHYSFIAANIAPLFGKSFYWNCGMPWLYRRGWIEEFFFRRAMRKSMLVTGTEGLKNLYTKTYKLRANRVLVAPNGIKLERYIPWRTRRAQARAQLGITSDQKIIFFAHRLSARKGADRIKRIAAYFERNRSVVFVVAGSGPLEATISGGNIRCVGNIPQNTIPLYMAAANVFFMPSEEEGFPHVLLEAMAVGLPIVASNVGGVREMVPPGVKDFIISGDDAIFAQKIKALLDDETLSARIAEEEKEWVARYDMPGVARIVIDLVEKTR